MCTWWKRSRRRTLWRRCGATSSPGTSTSTPGMSHGVHDDDVPVAIRVRFQFCFFNLWGSQEVKKSGLKFLQRKALMPIYIWVIVMSEQETLGIEYERENGLSILVRFIDRIKFENKLFFCRICTCLASILVLKH